MEVGVEDTATSLGEITELRCGVAGQAVVCEWVVRSVQSTQGHQVVCMNAFLIIKGNFHL